MVIFVLLWSICVLWRSKKGWIIFKAACWTILTLNVSITRSFVTKTLLNLSLLLGDIICLYLVDWRSFLDIKQVLYFFQRLMSYIHELAGSFFHVEILANNRVIETS
jgi:hypothetical protein